jgi:NAD-dependent deacetylase
MSGAPRIVVLTGAGVSAESGLGTFRDKGGVWSQFSWEELATLDGFAANPERVLGFYNARRANLLAATENEAHRALARLQAALADAGGSLTIVTQNVDDLHERGGAHGVIHMHGELLSALCASCGWRGVWRDDISRADPCPACGPEGVLRPDVVWFGETPYRMDEIETALLGADLFVSIGTSGSVYPAAGFVMLAREHGIATLELNLEPSDNAWAFDDGRYGPASSVVPAWVEAVVAAL